jgi:hypothetical protein
MSLPRIEAHSSDRDVALIAVGLWPALECARPHGTEAVKRVALALRVLLKRRHFPPEAVLAVSTTAAILSSEVTRKTPSAEIMQAAESLGRTPGAQINVIATFHVGVAFSALMRGGMAPAEAVKAIAGLAMVLAGVDYDDIPGDRVKL